MAAIATRRGADVLTEIVGWCSELSGWQQDALRRIVEGRDLTADDVDELARLCKNAQGLEVEDVPELKPLKPEHLPKGSTTGKAVTLCSVAEPENVNALDPTQELKFAPTGLTVIFGYNGSGKSGYGRILRRACRARSIGEPILPNVLRGRGGTPASAIITYALDGTEQKPEQWVDGQHAVEALGSVSFFDSACAAVHVRDKHTIAFTPLGLDLLPKLGAVCKDVQKRLDDERKKLDAIRPKFLQAPMATGATAVGRLLKSLSQRADVESVEKLASLNDAERQRLETLPGLLANDPAKQAQELRNRSRRVGAVAATLRQAMGALSDDALAGLRGLAAEYQRKATAADAAAKLSFADDPLTGVGDDVWRELWEAARRYSTVAYPEREFPVVHGDDAVCVLCQQPLADAAKDRLQRFEKFVSDDTATQAADAKRAVDAAVERIDGLPLRDQATRDQLQDIEVADAALHKRTRRALAALVRRFRAVRAAHSSGNWQLAGVAAVADVEGVCSELDAATTSLSNAAAEIERTAKDGERKKLETELAELKAREWLATVLGDVKEHLTRLEESQKLKTCIDETKTNKITAKSKALAKEHATDQLRDAFASEIKGMQQGVRRLNVELASAAGEFGSSHYRIQLIGAHDTAVEAIVSEGEHQCIALAGFLAELATQGRPSAIVFDDPVSSLDYLWSECFARRLVEEAAQRQVIVFTHDVLFLHDLCGIARELQIAVEAKHIRAIGEMCGQIGADLPNDLQGLKARMNALGQEQVAIRRLYESNGDGYDLRVKQFYDRLRAAVERAVEERVLNGVIFRFRNEIKVGLLLKVSAITRNDAHDFHQLHIRCSENMTGHDRAAARGGTRLTPDDLKRDLEELQRLVDDLNARQNAVK